MHTDVPERDLAAFRQAWPLPLLRVKSVPGRRLADGRTLDGRAGLADVAHVLNGLAEQLWHQDQVAAGLLPPQRPAPARGGGLVAGTPYPAGTGAGPGPRAGAEMRTFPQDRPGGCQREVEARDGPFFVELSAGGGHTALQGSGPEGPWAPRPPLGPGAGLLETEALYAQGPRRRVSPPAPPAASPRVTAAGASARPRISSASSQEPGLGEVTPSAAPDKPCALVASLLGSPSVSHLRGVEVRVGPARTRVQRPGPEILMSFSRFVPRHRHRVSERRTRSGRRPAGLCARPRAGAAAGLHSCPPFIG